jgi:hypothetical protein
MSQAVLDGGYEDLFSFEGLPTDEMGKRSRGRDNR